MVSPLYARYAKACLEQALVDTRVVLLTGLRQAGKTTLARSLVSGSRSYHTLDS